MRYATRLIPKTAVDHMSRADRVMTRADRAMSRADRVMSRADRVYNLRQRSLM